MDFQRVLFEVGDLAMRFGHTKQRRFYSNFSKNGKPLLQGPASKRFSLRCPQTGAKTSSGVLPDEYRQPSFKRLNNARINNHVRDMFIACAKGFVNQENNLHQLKMAKEYHRDYQVSQSLRAFNLVFEEDRTGYLPITGILLSDLTEVRASLSVRREEQVMTELASTLLLAVLLTPHWQGKLPYWIIYFCSSSRGGFSNSFHRPRS